MTRYIQKPLWRVRMDTFYPEVQRTTLADERTRRRWASPHAVLCVAAADAREARAIALCHGHPAPCDPERQVDTIMHASVPIVALERDLRVWEAAWRQHAGTPSPRFGVCPHRFGIPCQCGEACALGARITC